MKFNLALLTVVGLVAMVYSELEMNPECFKRPNDKHPKECCKMPHFMPPKHNCKHSFPKAGGPPTPGSPPPGFNCVAQCMLKEGGIMTDDLLSKDAATTKMVSLVGSSSEWQTVAKSTVDTCYQKVASVATTKDNFGCNSAAGSFMDCLPSTMFTQCPASAWTDTEECKQLKAHLEKGCPMMTLWSHHHHHHNHNKGK